MLSVDNINADSNYIIVKQLCNKLIKTGKYNFFILLDKNRKYYKDDLHKSVKIIWLPLPRSKKHQVIHFNTNIFREIYKKYAIDLVWNNVVERGHHIRYFQDTLLDNQRVKVLNYHHYVIHRSLEYLSNYLPCTHILYDQIIGSLGADLNYFHTQHCYNMLIEEAKDILLPDQVKKIEDKSIVKLGGYINKIKSKYKYETYTFIYNHRLDGYKNWKDTFEVFDLLYNAGYKFKVIITAGDKGNLGSVNKEYVEIKSFSLHSDYINELSKCHCNVINSRHETYCISIAESILNDQVIVAPNKVTFPELVDQDYPHLFESKEEQYKILENLIVNNIREYNYKESNKLTIDQHSKNFDKIITDLFEKDLYESYFDRIKKESTKKEIKNYLQTRNEIDLTDFKNFIFKLGYASQSFPMSKIKKILNEFNFEYITFTNKYQKK